VAAGKRVEVAFTLPALAIAAVDATLHGSEQQAGEPAVPARDLLLLQPDGRLALFAGRRRLCTVGLPVDSSASPAYAQLLRLNGAASGSGNADADGKMASNHSELGGGKRPPSAGTLHGMRC
jgi:hypothetical protein